MTIDLVSLSDSDELSAYVSDVVNSDKKQYVLADLFLTPTLLRNMIFNSQLIAIHQKEKGRIEKLFAAITPPPGSNNLTLSMSAFYADKNFLTQSVELVKDLFEDEEYTKLRIVIDGDDITDELRTTLEESGFEMEIRINSTFGSQFMYSYFLK